ncbi:MAG: hypothetical protein IJN66_01680 [Muribaculaceae bacterium]|nr:hypothetical protein [Muribaculaceae bacterium]
MKIFKLFAICAIALIATSCGSVNKSKSYSFDSVRLEVNMNDLVCLGEADISVEYSTYLWGAFSNIEKVNGELYNSAHQKKLYIPNGNALFRDDKLDLAAYKLVEQFPGATYYQVVLETSAEDKMFLGKVCKKSAKVKAYKFKN